MNVLLTGTAGLLGSHVLSRLVNDSGVNLVLALFRNKIPSFNTNKTVFIKGDVTNPSLFENIYSSYGIDAVIHCAANAIVKNSEKSISSTFETNILGTTYLLESAKNAKVERFIYQSTDKTFGEQGSIKYTEDMPLKGRNAYELSKVCSDITAQNFNSYGLKTFCVRSCNMFGPNDSNFSRIVPGFLSKYFKNESPVIYSDSVKRVREFISALDVASGLVSLLCYSGDKRIFNLGSGFVKTIPQMADYIYSRAKLFLGNRLTCESYIIKDKEQFFPEIDFQEIDYSLAVKEINFDPITLNKIDELMDLTIKYYMNYFGIKES